MRTCTVALFAVCLATPLALPFDCAIAQPAEEAADPDDETPAFAPGLVAAYRSAGSADSPLLLRVEAKPAALWGDSSPHPRLPAEPFAVEWTGVLNVFEIEPLRFGASISGQVELALDDRIVLAGEGRTLDAQIAAEIPWTPDLAGPHRIRISFRSLANTPARLQLWWEGDSFSREPLPPSRLSHEVASLPSAVALDRLRETGRRVAERLGCAACHATALPGVDRRRPGPALVDAGKRLSHDWLLRWLSEPSAVRPHARMPSLFSRDRRGEIERMLIADHLLQSTGGPAARQEPAKGDFRAGRETFVGVGCAACHLVPDSPPSDEASLLPERYPLIDLPDRFSAEQLAAHLRDPHVRYVDGRMPKLPLSDAESANVAAYLLASPATNETPTGSAPAKPALPTPAPPTPAELADLSRDLQLAQGANLAAAVMASKGCVQCHAGIGETPPPSTPRSAPLSLAEFRQRRGCLAPGGGRPHFALDDESLRALDAYLEVAALERHQSAFESGRRLLAHARCDRCHQRDGDGSSPLETIGRDLWTPFLYRLPFLRTPRLSGVAAKYRHDFLTAAVRDGVRGMRPDWFSYRMPSFGETAPDIVAALAATDGDPLEPDPPLPIPDSAIAALGPTLAGFEGYSCVSCHVWNGASLAAVEPGSVGPELTTVTGRVRREWFDRWLESPLRVHPGTPMPSFFRKGQPAPLRSVLAGDARQQKDALWSYLAQGKEAPSPKPKAPILTPSPAPGEPPFVSQVPLRLPTRELIESLCVITSDRDLVAYDLQRGTMVEAYRGARILRQANLWRSLELSGEPVLGAPDRQGQPDREPAYVLATAANVERVQSIAFDGYSHAADGIELRWRLKFPAATVALVETLRIERRGETGSVRRDLAFSGLPAGAAIELRVEHSADAPPTISVSSSSGAASQSTSGIATLVRLSTVDASGADATGAVEAAISFALPPPLAIETSAPQPAVTLATDDGLAGGSLERPGYRAIAYPRPKTAEGEDRVMPSAIVADPASGRVFVASLKLGQLLALDDPQDNGQNATFANYGRGLFQDVFAMEHDGRDLLVLHRRNLSRLRDVDANGTLDRVERMAVLPHSAGDAYDWAYGMIPEPGGSYLLTLAPHSNPHLTGSGAVTRLTVTGDQPRLEPLAFGLRNALGWRRGPDGESFFTDNQGDWVAANKLCHVSPGAYYGYPNRAQADRVQPTPAKTAVWVPYDWARSINGLAYDDSQGKFGPFAGQFFMAELMYGGAIIRANVERINGVYQGACFPFWGRGLLGPLALAFDGRGRLWVGGVTQPGWMGQPDRGALFRIDFTGTIPFEMQSMHVRPDGFRIRFTAPVDRQTAGDVASYRLERYRYEYTGAYGSPELDRTPVKIEHIEIAPDGQSVELKTERLVKDRVYYLRAAGVQSNAGEPLVHATAAYTLNEIP